MDDELPGIHPHAESPTYLIGPGLTPPDFAVDQRPVGIVSASIILPGQHHHRHTHQDPG